MAIGFDAFTGSGGVGSFTFSHTVGASATLLVVGVVTGASADTITGVTYAGSPMTLAQSGTESALFFLISPTVGTNDVTVTYTNSSGNGARATVISYTGAKGIGATNAQSTTSTPQTLSLTTTVVDSWLTGFTGARTDFSGTNYTAGSSTTLRGTVGGGGRIDMGAYDSNSAKSPTGSYSLSSVGNDTFNNRQIIAEVLEGIPDTFTPKASFFE